MCASGSLDGVFESYFLVFVGGTFYVCFPVLFIYFVVFFIMVFVWVCFVTIVFSYLQWSYLIS